VRARPRVISGRVSALSFRLNTSRGHLVKSASVTPATLRHVPAFSARWTNKDLVESSSGRSNINQKALIPGRTDHICTKNSTTKQLAVFILVLNMYLLAVSVSTSGLLFRPPWLVPSRGVHTWPCGYEPINSIWIRSDQVESAYQMCTSK